MKGNWRLAVLTEREKDSKCVCENFPRPFNQSQTTQVYSYNLNNIETNKMHVTKKIVEFRCEK